MITALLLAWVPSLVPTMVMEPSASASPPPLQRPSTAQPRDVPAAEGPAPAPETSPAPAPAATAPAATAPAATTAPEAATPTAPNMQPPTVEPARAPTPVTTATPPPDDEMLTVAAGSRQDKPPFYNAQDAEALRRRYGIEPTPPEDRRVAKWRCLIADPTCRISFEINATSAYAYRLRQGDVREGNAVRWHSGRTQYDFWLNLPVLEEIEGRVRYTKMTLGPKGGVTFSDTGDLWGNVGIAFRTWLGRGKWAPTIEFTSALAFKLGGRKTRDLGGEKAKFEMSRGPVGFTADVGVGLGGYGAIVLGGQYDSPLAREEVPDRFRVAASGMFFVGFRGNILWGGPAGAAALTHGLTQRYAKPVR